MSIFSALVGRPNACVGECDTSSQKVACKIQRHASKHHITHKSLHFTTKIQCTHHPAPLSHRIGSLEVARHPLRGGDAQVADEGEDARDGREGRPEYGERQWVTMIHGGGGAALLAGEVVAHAGAAG